LPTKVFVKLVTRKLYNTILHMAAVNVNKQMKNENPNSYRNDVGH